MLSALLLAVGTASAAAEAGSLVGNWRCAKQAGQGTGTCDGMGVEFASAGRFDLTVKPDCMLSALAPSGTWKLRNWNGSTGDLKMRAGWMTGSFARVDFSSDDVVRISFSEIAGAVFVAPLSMTCSRTHQEGGN